MHNGFSNFLKHFFTSVFNSSQEIVEQGSMDFPVYIINLERSPDRRAFAVSQIRKHGVEPTIIQAVDGRELDYQELIKRRIYDREAAETAFSRQLLPEEIGCTYSHINTFKKICEDGVEAALVLEDDAALLDQFVTRLHQAYRELPPVWGVLHLNCPCPGYKEISDNLVKYDGSGALPVAASAYLISRKGAEYYLNEAFPIRYPADSLIGRGLRWGVEIYGVKTPLTSINNVFRSLIQKPQGFIGHTKHWVKFVVSPFLRRT